MAEDLRKTLLIWPPCVTPRWVPLGVAFLAAYLKEGGPFWAMHAMLKHGLRIAENHPWGRGFLEPLREKKAELLFQLVDVGMRSVPWSLTAIKDALSEGAPAEARQKIARLLDPVLRVGAYGVVGISVNFPEQLFFALLLAQRLKESVGSAAVVVLGGAQVTKHIDDLRNDARVFDAVDVLVVHDGEEALSRLCRAQTRASARDIPNAYVKADDGSRTFVAPEKSFTLEPDHFPVPDFSGFDPDAYDDVTPLIVTKGCPWNKCSFCTYGHGPGRHFSIASVEKAMSVLKGAERNAGLRKFVFVDDALPPRFMDALAGALSREDMALRWSANIILEKTFADPAFCRRLKESGLDSVNIGIESASRRLLCLMNKRHQDMEEADVVEAMRSLKGAGIGIQLNIIFGFPTETWEEARQTLDFLLRNASLVDVVSMQPFSLEDHTPVADEPHRFGITRVWREDKSIGRRLGYRYSVAGGLTPPEAERFIREEALPRVRAALRQGRRA